MKTDVRMHLSEDEIILDVIIAIILNDKNCGIKAE